MSQENYNSGNKRNFHIGLHKLHSAKSLQSISSNESSQRTSNLDFYRCVDHPNKVALYSHNDKTFCERCAILLASQGYNVKKISTSANHRKNEVSEFIRNVHELEQQYRMKKIQVKDSLIASQQFYGHQIQQINEYFEMIYQSLELEKNKCYNYILNERKNAQQPARLVNDQIDLCVEQLGQMVDDITESIDSIFEIQESSYKPVITSYLTKLEIIGSKFNELQINPIELRKIQFAGVPDQIHSLSQILIQNSDENVLMNEPQKQKIEQTTNSLMFSFEGQQLILAQSSDHMKTQFCQ